MPPIGAISGQQVVRHFTNAIYIVDTRGSEPKVLMLLHKKLHSWLAPGGHIEQNELPHESALREALEETGVQAEFLDQSQPDFPNAWKFPQPHHVQLEEIEKGTHYHIDFVYFARLKGDGAIRDAEGHGDGGIRWFSHSQLQALGPNEILQEARASAAEALQMVK